MATNHDLININQYSDMWTVIFLNKLQKKYAFVSFKLLHLMTQKLKGEKFAGFFIYSRFQYIKKFQVHIVGQTTYG